MWLWRAKCGITADTFPSQFFPLLPFSSDSYQSESLKSELFVCLSYLNASCVFLCGWSLGRPWLTLAQLPPPLCSLWWWWSLSSGTDVKSADWASDWITDSPELRTLGERQRGRQTMSFSYVFVFLCSVFLEGFRCKSFVWLKRMSFQETEQNRRDGTVNFGGISSSPDKTNLLRVCGTITAIQQPMDSKWFLNTPHSHKKILMKTCKFFVPQALCDSLICPHYRICFHLFLPSGNLLICACQCCCSILFCLSTWK